ncbi:MULTISPECIES: DUF1450 domain-containing protein [Paenibacillus]|uniref:Uncharacterized protein YuzB (UPF0349 family) n=2 Tax=Paenibacillus TaxID=44249 RepID=A0AAP5GZE6_PAEAM|nr:MULTISPECIES: DUF1450 domain-containing protein [Paenibacillus]KQY88141.1 hypothetical protein ASD24_25815 [Paenibacillus sp. Root52]MCG7377148.1 YuzB family protein [Paenibacillus sp. ACRSA]MCM3173375.1 YuzB family protein [Paenibacillus sp. MER 99-2]MDQ0170978.1 uncharacterized protein YuzB (UPF0349 family) [Paenibacillus tundrae]MDR6722545.1 uncharacterized protein YuzB (UPF0349 family) [Paenibacillus amylolyticus]
MANDIRVCEKCNHIRLKSIVPKLEKMAPDTEIKIGCKSYCGPCAKRAFVFINGRYISAPSEEEVLAKVAKFVK